MEKTRFEIIENGTTYHLPEYTVVEGVGIEETDNVQALTFVRGSKVVETVEVLKEDGILHEALLSVMIHDLTFKNNLVPSEQTEYTIRCLDEALESIKARTNDREESGVEVTYSE